MEFEKATWINSKTGVYNVEKATWINSKTDVYNVLNKKTGYPLGMIRWYGSWRQYCFYPYGETIFNDSRLEDIQKAIRELMDDRKNK